MARSNDEMPEPETEDTRRAAASAHSAERRARRAAFAADVLELDTVLEYIARRADSSLGKRVIGEVAPLGAELARERLARLVELALLARVNDLPTFGGVSDVLPPGPEPVVRLDEDRMAAMRDFLQANVRLKDWSSTRAVDSPRLAAWLAASPDTSDLAQAIDRVLDARGRVRDDASPQLQRLRATAQELNERLERAARAALQRPDIRIHLTDGSIHRRGGRPVLAVKAKLSGRVKGLVHDRSQSGESVFIEPAECVELGNRLAEVNASERNEVERILTALSQRVLAERAAIHSAAERIGELELCAAATRWAKSVDGRVALEPGQAGAAQGLLLRAARHPQLVQQVAEGRLSAVVPIDLRLGVEFDLLLITGPNTGGKTLALKTAGLFALLTACGLPVPAGEGTTVPQYDAVLADIGDEQEIRQNLSTFASHLVRVRAALERATPRTLVLLDELGGGTDPDEGAALGEAILETLLARRAPTLASTHIGKLKEFSFRRGRAENACAEFDPVTLEPCYRLLLGTPGESSALVIARRLGLPQEVVTLATQRLQRRDIEVSRTMEELRKARVAAEATRQTAEREREEASHALRDLEGQRVAMEHKSRQLEAEAQKGIEERVRDAMRQLAKARQRLEQVPPEARKELALILDALEADLTGASLSERRQAFLQTIGKGSLVYLPRYRQRVIVHKVNREKREIVAKLGALNVKVTFDEVTPYESL
jgi:DNA mismatch repair protein MutS2